MRKTLAAVFLVAALGAAQNPNSDHYHGVNARGDRAMGFSHEKTTHHFLLRKDGGIIEVRANAANDTESREQIRTHLGHVSQMFAEGDFSAPMFIHTRNPPGASIMRKLRKEIAYYVEEIDTGARLRITTVNPRAIQAIHQFLRFQIADHQTGDPIQVGVSD